MNEKKNITLSEQFQNLEKHKIPHCLPIVQLPITYRLILRRTWRTSDQMPSGYTSDINNGVGILRTYS
jgi:hypothetical protein